MDVSVIIVNYNTCNLVKKCVASIFEKTKNVSFEVIVVDGFSEDSTLSILNGIKNNYEGKMIVQRMEVLKQL